MFVGDSDRPVGRSPTMDIAPTRTRRVARLQPGDLSLRRVASLARVGRLAPAIVSRSHSQMALHQSIRPAAGVLSELLERSLRFGSRSIDGESIEVFTGTTIEHLDRRRSCVACSCRVAPLPSRSGSSQRSRKRSPSSTPAKPDSAPSANSSSACGTPSSPPPSPAASSPKTPPTPRRQAPRRPRRRTDRSIGRTSRLPLGWASARAMLAAVSRRRVRRLAVGVERRWRTVLLRVANVERVDSDVSVDTLELAGRSAGRQATSSWSARATLITRGRP